ncbi:RHS repeat-associated core domain-containing protein [Rosenbergiella epipactidis]|uniref:RHS repeat-associated core domain-containing protein n=1 Tax=Rosenbergiella epipactidis TaxID=1544694 RepID=UPI003BA847D8
MRWQGVNNAWGKQVYQPMLTGGRVEQNLRMQGQYYDEESGLHYNLFRYYDPDSGRFTQLDPIGLAGGLNLYQYAPNALGWVDPLGLSRKCSTFLYRGDKRGPNVIFREGFRPLGNSSDLLLHAKDNRSPPSNFISTSSDADVARNFAARDEQKGFVYAIRQQPSGIDVNKVLGNNTPFPDEVEIAIPGAISNKDIMGVTPVNGDGDYVGFSIINFLRY